MQENHQTFPSAAEAFVLVIVAFLLEMLVDSFLYSIHAALGLDEMASATLGRLIAYGLLFGALLEWKGISYASLFHPSTLPLRPHVTSLLLPVLLLTPGLLIAESGLLSLLDDLVSLQRPDYLQRMLESGFAAMVLACVLAPVLEEMLFRGIILRSFLLQYDRLSAILGSSVVFGFAHLNGFQFVAGCSMGLVLGWLYERTRSLWPTILLHAAFNTGAVMLDNGTGELGLSGATIVGGLALSSWATVFLYRRFAS